MSQRQLKAKSLTTSSLSTIRTKLLPVNLNVLLLRLSDVCVKLQDNAIIVQKHSKLMMNLSTRSSKTTRSSLKPTRDLTPVSFETQSTNLVTTALLSYPEIMGVISNSVKRQLITQLYKTTSGNLMLKSGYVTVSVYDLYDF